MSDAFDELREMSMDNLESKSWERALFDDSSSSGVSKDQRTIVDPRALKNIYFSEEWVFIVVDRIAMNLAQLPWQVFKESTVDGELVCEPAVHHPYQRVLDDPNPLQSAFEFKYNCVTDYCVTGNCLIYNSRVRSWLVQTPVEIMALDIDGAGNLNSYMVVGQDPLAFPAGKRQTIDPKSMIHVKRPNPSSVYWGLSPLIPGQNAILFNRYSKEYLLNFYKKGAQPGMVLEMTEESNAEQAKKLLLTLETTYTGRNNQRRGMVLPKGVKATNIAHTLADQQLITYIESNREEIINLFGVPKEELSIQSGSTGLGSDQYKTALKNFWSGPLTSIAMQFESAMTKALKDRLGKGYIIKLNMSAVPALQEDLMQKALLATAMLSTLTFNEVRAKVWKEKPYVGGDVIKDLRPMFGSDPFGAGKQPSTLVGGGDTQSLLEGPPNPEGMDRTQMGEEIKPLSLQDSINYRDSNVTALDTYAKSEGGKWLETSQAKQELHAKKGIVGIAKLFLGILENQVIKAVQIIKDELVEKAASVPNRDQLRARIDAAFKASQKDWADGYVDVLIPQIEIGYDSVLDIPFNKPYQDELEAIRATTKTGRREILRRRGKTIFTDLNKTTIENIMQAVEDGMAASQTVQEIAATIRDKAELSAKRSMVIARTETLTASSIGQAAAMEHAADVIPNLVKVWVTALDDRVRDSHKEMEAEVVYSDETFSNGLSYPRDTKGEPGDVIQCRCTMLVIGEDDIGNLGLKITTQKR